MDTEILIIETRANICQWPPEAGRRKEWILP